LHQLLFSFASSLIYPSALRKYHLAAALKERSLEQANAGDPPVIRQCLKQSILCLNKTTNKTFLKE